jgi:Icc-related predicted phosphoesterase
LVVRYRDAVCQSAAVQMLLVGDLHYDMRQLDWLMAEASDYEIVVVAGDLLDISSAVPLEAQVPVVLGYLERMAARAVTVVCSGNHDLTGRDGDGEKAALWLARAAEVGVLTDFSSTFLGDTLLTVCPWWDGPIGRERVEGFLADEATKVRQDWVWVYHWPPPDEPVSWTGTTSYGDRDLAGWIERFHPALVLTGHVHQAPLADGGSWIARSGSTWIINAGRQIGPVPCHAVIDLAAGSARWWSFEATDERSLRPAG